MQHFLAETDLPAGQVPLLFSMAADWKRLRGGEHPLPLQGQSWGMLFSKQSTRTRVSFEVGIHELGGHAVRLDQSNLQTGRGESLEDTARVLGRYLHGLVIRTHDHADLEAYAREAGIPVVNALSDFLHPCQIFADVFTLAEKMGSAGDDLAAVRGRKLVFLGDCSSNMAHSWILGSALFGIELVLAGPAAYQPGPEIRERLEKEFPGHAIDFREEATEAVRGADAVYTDVWVSMGDEAEAAERRAALQPYAVTGDLLAQAGTDPWILHCMPVHADEEISTAVLARPRAVLYDQAENRLHLQKAVLAHLAEEARPSPW